MAFWSTKAAISLKRVKMQKKLLREAYIGTHHRSFERYHPRPPTASLPQDWGSHPNQNSNRYYLKERVKLRTSNLATTITGSTRSKAHEQFWRKGSVGVSRDCLNFLGVPPIISGMGKATDFKFGQYIQRVHPNKSPLKF